MLDPDLDPDPTFHFDVDPDPDPSQILYMRCDLIIFNILESILKFSWKKNSLALHLAEMDTDPDREALDADPYSDPSKMMLIRPNPDPQHCIQYFLDLLL